MKSICIVDDFYINLLVIEEYLKENYNTYTFNSAKQCISYLEKNMVDLIMMDFQMPEMDGYKATKIIKNRWPKIIIIGITASPLKENIKKAYDSGMIDIIEKPIYKDRILKIIKNNLCLI